METTLHLQWARVQNQRQQPFDPTVPVSEASGELTRIHDTLRQELNSFLARENWEEATEIQ